MPNAIVTGSKMDSAVDFEMKKYTMGMESEQR
jgi:hypothetical protein